MHLLNFQYTQRFCCYSLAWSVMTSSSANVTKLKLDFAVYGITESV